MSQSALVPTHAMTVDVEDWFQVEAFSRCIARGAWDGLARRVEANTDRLLHCFADAGIRATFFTLSWVAERHPALIRRIVAQGHELASHGHGHERVDRLTEAQFRADVTVARTRLEDTGGVPVIGYRAPTFSIGPSTPWAHRTLAACGYRYSSSVYPVRHDLYGTPDAPRFPFTPLARGVTELPMTTLRIGRVNFPVSGGGYFRLLPYGMFRAVWQIFQKAERGSAIFYIHPWELDPEQPRPAGARAISIVRHRINLARTERRLRSLVRDFRFAPMREVFAPVIADA